MVEEKKMDSLKPLSNGSVQSNQNNNARKVDASNLDKSVSDSAKQAIPDVEIELSSANNSAAESEALMRAAKIKEMREAIEEGRFPLDARKIAENFAELEKLL